MTAAILVSSIFKALLWTGAIMGLICVGLLVLATWIDDPDNDYDD